MADRIIVQHTDALTSISVNRPDEGNIFTNDMAADLAGIMSDLPSTTKAVLLRGGGPDFCLGRDLSTLQLDGPLPEALELRNRNEVIFNCYGSLRAAAVPVISMVQGRARGFGCALAAIADITVAASDAVFQLPEMGHGIMPGMAMSALVDRVPRKALVHMICSAEAISADRALAFGLVTKVVAPAELETQTMQLVASIARASVPALNAVKEYARAAYAMDMRSATDFARNLHATVNSSSELRR